MDDKEKEKEEILDPLSKESSINEIFDALLDEGQTGVKVIPITISGDAKDTRLAVLIRGEHVMASYIMAELMTVIQNVFDLQEQEAASEDRIIRV